MLGSVRKEILKELVRENNDYSIITKIAMNPSINESEVDEELEEMEGDGLIKLKDEKIELTNKGDLLVMKKLRI